MKIRRSASGFTLIELILVIVLLSIVSLFAASRFIGKSSFSAYAIQDQVISVIRQVQLNRMQSNLTDPDDIIDMDGNFRLRVEESCIGSVAACALSEDERASRSDVVADNYVTFSVTNSPAPGYIDFDLLGNPVDLNSGEISIWIEDKSGNSRCEVLINSQGYVSRGGCS